MEQNQLLFFCQKRLKNSYGIYKRNNSQLFVKKNELSQISSLLLNKIINIKNIKEFSESTINLQVNPLKLVFFLILFSSACAQHR